jgi:hypothetical protein
MPAHVSDPGDLALHGPRVLGFATGSRIAARFGLDRAFVEDALLDFEAAGWVRRSGFGGSSGWSLTQAGRRENERRLAVELDIAGARETVGQVHTEFLPLNGRLARACTDWQIRPTRIDPLSANDHTDWVWDEQVVTELASLDRALRELSSTLVGCLRRFGGYAERYSSACGRVSRGERRWVDAPELDSCHTVWIQLHEDLLATLGVPRRSDA